MENDLDVVNLSLGGAFGRATDPDAVAATNAARAGVVVVASAGNNGACPVHPQRACRRRRRAGGGGDGLDRRTRSRVFFTTPTERLLLQNSNLSSALPVNAPVRVLVDDPATGANESLGCIAGAYAAVQPGEIVVTHRGGCTRTDRVIHATAARAAAVVMINNGAGFPPFEGSQGGAIPFLGAQDDQEAALLAADGNTASIEDVPEEDRFPTRTTRRSPTSARAARGTATAERSPT